MKNKIVAMVVLFSVVSFPIFAKEKTYTVKLTVASAVNQKTGDTSESDNINRGLLGGIVHHDRHHNVIARYVEATGDDGNIYEISPRDQKLIVLPGTYSARFTDRDMVVLMPSGREAKFQVIAVAKAAK